MARPVGSKNVIHSKRRVGVFDTLPEIIPHVSQERLHAFLDPVIRRARRTKSDEEIHAALFNAQARMAKAIEAHDGGDQGARAGQLLLEELGIK